MATSIAYTSREFATILADLRTNLQNATESLPNVNDFLESNEGRFLLDQWAAVAEMSNFTLDRTAAESYIDTLEERASLVSLLKLIGYQPKNPTPEVVNVTISRADTSTTEITVPRKTIINSSASEKIAFATSSSAVFTSTTTSVTIPAVQGTWSELSIAANGQPYYAVVLPRQYIADGQVEVLVDNVTWSQATNNTFVGHANTDLVYRVIYTSDKRVLVEFGDGVEGKIPPVGAKVLVSFLVTLGIGGHVNANTLTSLNSVNDANGEAASLSITNAMPSTGGSDYETIERARRRYPSTFKTLRRAVTLADWEALSLNVGGVLRAYAVDYNTDSSMSFFNVKVYVVGENGQPSDALNTKVREELLKSKVNATLFTVESPEKKDVSVIGKIKVYDAYDPVVVQTQAITALNALFTMTGTDDSAIKLGTDVPLSKIITAIQNVDGVSSVTLTEPTSDVVIASNEYASLTSVSIEILK
jgi:phage-related baseplate assembly protein